MICYRNPRRFAAVSQFCENYIFCFAKYFAKLLDLYIFLRFATGIEIAHYYIGAISMENIIKKISDKS